MGSPTVIALTGFVVWALALLVLMEAIRTKMVMSKEVAANGFVPDNANLSPFMQRLARAHANCIEGLPIFGGLLVIALISGHPEITNSLAYVFLGARVIQSLIHLSSLSALAVTLKFSAFSVQLVVAIIWSWQLLSVLVSGN